MRIVRSLLGCGAVAMGACGLALLPGGGGTINMDKWTLTSMDVSLAGGVTTICPSQPVQLSIVAQLQHKERDKTRVVETWSGDRPLASSIGKLGFETFEGRSPQGTLDGRGYFTPDLDALNSVDGFELHLVHTPNPKFTWSQVYKPSYDCVSGAGGRGAVGGDGTAGSKGSKGALGRKNGGDGGRGSQGAPGAPGPSLVAHATIVRTPHYDALVLLQIEGDLPATVLFEPTKPFVLEARGGEGGRGGLGGSGGKGADGSSSSTQGGNGGNGGPGGSGAAGGVGGAGGSIVLTYDARFPQLAEIIGVDVSGGPGGLGGDGGPGGSGGAGGHGTGEHATNGMSGSAGARGPDGAQGAWGAPGRAEVAAGDVSDVFAALPEGVSLF